MPKDPDSPVLSLVGFPHSSVSKESACFAGDPALIPGWERSPGGGNGNPLQYACLENAMDRGASGATIYAITRVGHNLVRHEFFQTLIVDLYDFKKNIFWLQVPNQIHDLQIFFSHSVDCIFTFLLLSLETQVFNFDENQFIFSVVSIVAYAFNFISKKSLPNSGSQRYTPVFF